MARVVLSPAECPVPCHRASPPPPPVARRRDTTGKTPHVRNDSDRVGPGAARGRALARRSALPAAAIPLSSPGPDAPTATPEDSGDPADLARCGGAAAAGAGDRGRPALDRSLYPGAVESAHRPGGECQTLSDADRPPGVSPALAYGGASHR